MRRLTIAGAAVATAAAAGAVLFAAGRASAATPASAATSSSVVGTQGAPPSATPDQFATVAVGQNEAQVVAEMGSTGTMGEIDTHHTPQASGFSLTWTDSTSLLGTRTFVVDFVAPNANTTAAVTDKFVDPLAVPFGL